MRKRRDYKAEYRRRIERALARGLTRSEGRGHPRANQHGASTRASQAALDPKLEAALKQLRRGRTLREAARDLRVSPERLSRYIKAHAGAARVGRGWSFNDQGRRRIPFIEDGEVRSLWVRGYEPARLAGQHWDEANRVLGNHDLAAAFQRRWENVAIRDAAGRLLTFTTDLNEIYRAVHANDAPFEQIYQLIR